MNFNKLAKISVFDLTAICRSHMHMSRLDCQTRVNLHSAIRNQPISVQEAIEVDVDLAIQKGLVKYGRIRERNHVEEDQGHSKRRRLHKEKNPVEEYGFFFPFFLFVSF